jgi:hypothetical protein
MLKFSRCPLLAIHFAGLNKEYMDLHPDILNHAPGGRSPSVLLRRFLADHAYSALGSSMINMYEVERFIIENNIAPYLIIEVPIYMLVDRGVDKLRHKFHSKA